MPYDAHDSRRTKNVKRELLRKFIKPGRLHVISIYCRFIRKISLERECRADNGFGDANKKGFLRERTEEIAEKCEHHRHPENHHGVRNWPRIHRRKYAIRIGRRYGCANEQGHSGSHGRLDGAMFGQQPMLPGPGTRRRRLWGRSEAQRECHPS